MIDGIEEDLGNLNYDKLDDAIFTIMSLGRGCFLSKIDVEHAFKLIPIHPDDIPLLGFKWKGKYYADKTLAMGLRTSCAVFDPSHFR